MLSAGSFFLSEPWASFLPEPQMSEPELPALLLPPACPSWPLLTSLVVNACSLKEPSTRVSLRLHQRGAAPPRMQAGTCQAARDLFQLTAHEAALDPLMVSPSLPSLSAINLCILNSRSISCTRTGRYFLEVFQPPSWSPCGVTGFYSYHHGRERKKKKVQT